VSRKPVAVPCLPVEQGSEQTGAAADDGRLEASVRSWTGPIAELVTGPQRRPASVAPAVEANARLTGTNAIVLLVLLAVEGATILSIRRLLPVHYFVGLLLIPPVVLKMATTGRRFAAYYLGDPRFRAAGPPPFLLRLAGPLVVVLTVAVFGTGLELWLFGTQYGSVWLTAHKATFVLWFVVMVIHVVGHLERAPLLALRDLANRPALPGAAERRAWIAAALLFGAALACGSLAFHSPFVVPLEH
jgi:hypothetical protein